MNRKMKMYSFALLMAIASILSLTSMSGNDDLSANVQEETPPANAVGRVYPNGGTQIYTNRLVPYFQSGESIQEFQLFQSSNGWVLLRKGILANGNARTEIVPLGEISNGFLTVDEGLSVISVCTRLNCSNGYCRPDNELSGCTCAIGEGCSLFAQPAVFLDVVIQI